MTELYFMVLILCYPKVYILIYIYSIYSIYYRSCSGEKDASYLGYSQTIVNGNKCKKYLIPIQHLWGWSANKQLLTEDHRNLSIWCSLFTVLLQLNIYSDVSKEIFILVYWYKHLNSDSQKGEQTFLYTDMFFFRPCFLI